MVISLGNSFIQMEQHYLLKLIEQFHTDGAALSAEIDITASYRCSSLNCSILT